MNGDKTEEKQNYLTEEIIEKGYDQQKFVDFCSSKREGGDNISIWTVDELRLLVKEFQSKQKASIPQQQEEVHQEEVHQEEVHQEEAHQEEVPLDNNEENAVNENQPIEENKEENKNVPQKPQPAKEGIPNQIPIEREEGGEIVLELQCRKLEKSQLNDKDIKVIIENPQEVSKFLEKYVAYDVKTNVEDQWVVQRRYNDFLWLRKVLARFNPGQVIPPLPDKKIGKKRFEKEFIMRRMNFLQKFIDDVMVNEYFKASQPLIQFLSLTNRQAFEKAMKELGGYTPSPYLEEFKTFSGAVQMAKEDLDKEKYFSKIAMYFNNQDILFDRVRDCMKTFKMGMKMCIGALDAAQKEFETLYVLNDRVVMKTPIKKSYQNISNFLKSYKEVLEQQELIMKKHFKTFFKYTKMEGISYHELISSRDAMMQRYLGEKNRLNAIKEKNWIVKDTSKWGIQDMGSIDMTKLTSDKEYAISQMFTKETLKVDSMMKYSGFLNRMTFQELKKMIDVNCLRYVNNIEEFIQDFTNSLEIAKNLCYEMKNFEDNPVVSSEESLK